MFNKDEMIDCISVSKGKGFEGASPDGASPACPARRTEVCARLDASARAPRARRVTVARPGQHGYHHRTEINKKIYRVGKEGRIRTRRLRSTTRLIRTSPPWAASPLRHRQERLPHDQGWHRGPAEEGHHPRQSLFKQIRGSRRRRFPSSLSTRRPFGHGRFQTAEEKAKTHGR